MTVEVRDLPVLDVPAPLPASSNVTTRPEQAPAKALAALEVMDRPIHAMAARWTGGLSPAAVTLALLRLATSSRELAEQTTRPGKRGGSRRPAVFRNIWRPRIRSFRVGR
ncbi:poly-beta-hydroxybutyrate polymerase N-terminal domain-containing protein [Bradyrhizobium sp. BRP22]|uniref:poly-beta-hydroxybutyrate polymerase N-terminal domain-containing protein n=1 Tax=Bradyrhizobium sp. BRP22 TaxID=2793821 RepID=UPI0031FBE908